MKKPLATLLAIFLTGSFALLNFHVSSAALPIAQKLIETSVLYVLSGGTSTVCSSWADACELQTALLEAINGDQIWVAAGTYTPVSTTSDPREATFELRTGVAIYGGFPSIGGNWQERDWKDNLTTLSGDIGILDNSTDNSYHVVTGNGVDGSAIMDGFTISEGHANGISMYIYGGGMYNQSSSPTLTNIIFSTNSAYDGGGGMYNYSSSNPTLINVIFSGNSTYAGGGMANNSSSPTLTNVTFSGNSGTTGGGMYNDYGSSPKLTNVTFSDNPATIYGGGMYNGGSSPVLNNVTFSGNTAISGGGMYNLYYSNPTLTNVTFSGNSVGDAGGGIYNTYYSNPNLTNSIVWGNTPDQINNAENSSPSISYSDVQGCGGSDAWDTTCGTDLGGNIDSDPLLGPLADNGGFTLTRALGKDSPAIDSGDPNNGPSSDQRGFYRPIDGNNDGIARCDMGAYEYGSGLILFLPVIMR